MTSIHTEHGFTLIELLATVSIIGILASIVIPQFNEYREKGFDARAQVDLRHVATAEEAYYSTYTVYKSCTNLDCATILAEVSSLSEGVLLEFDATANGFSGTSTHPKGTGRVFSWPQ